MSKRIITRIIIMLGVTLISSLALAQGNADNGKKLFSQLCTSCHGDSGKGDGIAAASLKPKPRDLSDKTYMAGLKDEHLFEVIKKGGTGVGKSPLMPGFGTSMKDDGIQDVVAFLRSLAK